MPHRVQTVSLRALPALALVALGAALATCSGQPAATPPITPGVPGAPREVIIVARDDRFNPSVVDLVPGETILLRVVNAGLETHEAIIGDEAVQAAWEAAEAAVAGAPPGPTPAVSVPPELAGLRVVVRSGERKDVAWTVPDTPGLIVGCHIPGHYLRGMRSPVRLIVPGAQPAST
ncbi:MAG: hypothetical protein FJ038_09575 [Chloroflexi bacterium]|nr:hypothetical protein [Chloroflexota bacterium]